jgi:hypothetical protein
VPLSLQSAFLRRTDLCCKRGALKNNLVEYGSQHRVVS